jgi:hypothetical protein
LVLKTTEITKKIFCKLTHNVELLAQSSVYESYVHYIATQEDVSVPTPFFMHDINLSNPQIQ